jgi:hypothetical protein
MKTRSAYLLIGIALLFDCGRESRIEHSEKKSSKDSTIVFVDTRDASREQIGFLINKINEYDPKVIGVYAIFEEWKGTHDDSILVRSIYNTQKVVLLSYLDDSTYYVQSHPYFTKAASGTGVSSFLEDKNGAVAAFIPLMQIPVEGQMVSFPELIAYDYSEEAMNQFRKLNVNEHVKVYFHKALEDFRILTIENLRREDIEGKIVILGDIETSEEYMIPARGENGKIIRIPDIAVEANIILARLAMSESK